jgi:hypothetical protein
MKINLKQKWPVGTVPMGKEVPSDTRTWPWNPINRIDRAMAAHTFVRYLL